MIVEDASDEKTVTRLDSVQLTNDLFDVLSHGPQTNY